MSKALWLGGVVVLIGGGYLAGTVVTGKQVDKQFEHYVQVLQDQANGEAKVKSTVDSSMFSSQNSIEIEFLNLPEKVVSWAGTNKIKLDIQYSHGFLSSKSVITIAESDLLEKLKTFQKNSEVQPFVVTSDYSYNVGNGEVFVEGEITTDAFLADVSVGNLSIGSSEGSYEYANKTLSAEWVNKPTSFVGEGFALNIGDIKFEQEATSLEDGAISTKFNQNGFGKISVDNIDLDFINIVANLNGFLINVEQKVEGNRVLMDIDYSAKSFKFNDPVKALQFDEPVLNLSFDFDLLALENLVNNIAPLQQKADRGVDVSQEMLGLINGLTKQGISANVDRLEVTNSGSKAEGKALLKLAPFTIEEAKLDRKAFLKKADLKANIILPKKFLELLPNYNPAQINFFVGMGFMVDAGDNLEVNLLVENGVVTMNGKALPGF